MKKLFSFLCLLMLGAGMSAWAQQQIVKGQNVANGKDKTTRQRIIKDKNDKALENTFEDIRVSKRVSQQSTDFNPNYTYYIQTPNVNVRSGWDDYDYFGTNQMYFMEFSKSQSGCNKIYIEMFGTPDDVTSYNDVDVAPKPGTYQMKQPWIDYDGYIQWTPNTVIRYYYDDYYDWETPESTSIYINGNEKYAFATAPSSITVDYGENDNIYMIADFQMNSNNGSTKYRIIVGRPKTFQVSVNVNEDMGYVTGAGTYDKGSDITLTAHNNLGYHFVEWRDVNNQFITDNLSIEISNIQNNYNYIAVFEEDPAGVISATVFPNDAGYIIGTAGESEFENGHPYNGGTSITLTAYNNSNYLFSQWNDGVKTASRTFNVNGNVNLIAEFDHAYDINTDVSPFGVGIVVGGGTNKRDGSIVTLTASSNYEHLYFFDHWEVGGSTYPGGATITPTVTGNATYTAVFRTASNGKLTVTSNYGTVSGTGYVADPDHIYTGGTAVQLRVTPNSGYAFVQWSDGNTDNPRTVYIDGNADYTAEFQDLSVPLLGAYSYDNSKHHIEWGKWGYSNPNHTYVAFWDAFNTPQHSEFLRLQVWDETVVTNPGTLEAEATQPNNLQLCFWVSDFSNTYAGTMAPKEGVYVVTEPEVRYDAATANAAGYQYQNLWGYDESEEDYLDKVIIGCDPNKAIKDSYWSSDLGRLWTTAQSPYVAYYSKKNLDFGTPYDFYTVANGTTVTVERGKDDRAYVVATLPSGRVLFTVGEPAAVTYAVTFKNDDGTQIGEVQNLEEGESPTAPTEPAKDATTEYTYSFAGWKSSLNDNVYASNALPAVGTKAVIYTATYTETKRKYALTWIVDGVELTDAGITRGNIDWGTPITAPSTDPEKTGHTFAGWDADNDNVVDNVAETMPKAPTTYTAIFTPIPYAIIFYDEDGTTVLQSSDVDYDTKPACEEPTKAATAQYTYNFAGWSDGENTYSTADLPLVSGEATYTATYSSTVNKYTVTWQNYDGTELEKDLNVEFGATPSYDGVDPTRAEDDSFTYTFAGWDNDITAEITGGITFTATYTSQAKAFVLYDNKDEKDSYYTTLAGLAGQEIPSVTYNRNLTSKTWNVFSLPFNYSLIGINRTFAGDVYELTGINYDYQENYLTLFFTPQTIGIVANRPYLYYSETGIDMPVFTDVTISPLANNYYSVNNSGAGGFIEFRNTTCRQQLTRNDHNVIFITNNKLYYMSDNDIYMRAFRGYFYVNDFVLNVGVAPRVRISLDGHTATELEVVSDMPNPADGQVKKYIENGVMVIEREGVKYNATGAKIN